MPLLNLFKNCTYYWGFAAFVAYFVNHPLCALCFLLSFGVWGWLRCAALGCCPRCRPPHCSLGQAGGGTQR